MRFPPGAGWLVAGMLQTQTAHGAALLMSLAIIWWITARYFKRPGGSYRGGASICKGRPLGLTWWPSFRGLEIPLDKCCPDDICRIPPNVASRRMSHPR
ncbi:hypothetical protein KSP40_PGU010159 [Platanthera guangdongensis]|uniref:Uncharacterized protein n=1 Tax=Platanthera guangdongensis TaxID=2320717 RepID=A0ABR2MIU6_9ASPA